MTQSPQSDENAFVDECPCSRELAAGGFPPATEVLTASGPVTVSALTTDHRVYALDPTTGLAKLQPVRAVKRVSHSGDLVALETRRCDLRVHPDHRVICRTVGQDDLDVRPAHQLAEYEHYKFANDWRTLPGDSLETVDITDYIDDFEACAATDVHGHTVQAELPDGCEPVRRNSHVGYYFDAETFKTHQGAIESIATEVTVHAGPNHHRRPYRFDGDDFIEFLGWFVTEGSTTWSTSSDTVQVKIAQEDDTHRVAIQSLFERMGIEGHVDDRSVSVASKVLGRLFESLCGSGSHDKHLPEFVWHLDTDQQRLLVETLLAGDADDTGTFYTASDRLAAELCRLHVELGLKPRYARPRDAWQVSGRDVNDGFQFSRNVRRVPSPGVLYRLTVAEYPTVLAGRNGVFQWTGVSRVA